MSRTRKSHPPSLKAKVAVEAIKAHKTTARIAQMSGVHPTQVGGWKKYVLAGFTYSWCGVTSGEQSRVISRERRQGQRSNPTATCLTRMNPFQQRLYSLLDVQRQAPITR